MFGTPPSFSGRPSDRFQDAMGFLKNGPHFNIESHLFCNFFSLAQETMILQLVAAAAFERRMVLFCICCSCKGRPVCV